MQEKRLEQKLVEEVRKRGGIAYKFISPGRAGVPDRLVILPFNKIGFVEVKRPGKGKLRKIQKREIERLQGLGCKCYLLDDPDKLLWLINDIENGIEVMDEKKLIKSLLEELE